MPIEVELPDGTIAEFPDGTDNATMERALSSYRAAPKSGPDFSNVTSRVTSRQSSPPAKKPGLAARAIAASPAGQVASIFSPEGLAGMGKSFYDSYAGAKQHLTDSLGTQTGMLSTAMNRAGVPGANAFARNIVIPLQQSSQSQRADVANRRQADSELLATPEGFAGNVAGTGLQLVGPGAALRGTLAGRALMPTTVGGNALQGVLMGAMQPYENEMDRAGNAAVGGVAGAAGAALPSIIRRSGEAAREAIDPMKRQAMDAARRAGVPLHASQVSDSVPAKTIASMGKYLPFSGATQAAQRQQSAFNRALSQTFGADASQLSDDVMREAKNKLSAQFNDIYARNDVTLSPDALRRLVRVETEAGKRLTLDDSQIVRNQLDDILAEASDSGLITGQKYQALRTQIMKAEGADKVGSAVAELRRELDAIAADAVGPEDAAALRRIRGQWANLRTTQDVLKQVAGSGGDVRPAALWPAIRKGSTKEMRDLARVGQLIKDPIPDSGTAGRNLWLGLLGGGGVVGGPAAIPQIAGLMATGATAGRLANSNLLARALAGDGSKRIALGQLGGASPAVTIAALKQKEKNKGKK